MHVGALQNLVVTAIGGHEAGQVFDGDRRIDVIVRMPEALRSDLRVLARLPVQLSRGGYVPLGELAELREVVRPNQVSRENGKRRLVVSANVSGRDLGGFVADARATIAREIKLPAGYWLDYGGTFEQLESASARLALLVPLTLLLIFGLLFATFHSARDALLVFSGVPLALVGGVAALALRGMPLSITAGVGFITLSGVAVLTGVIVVTAFRDLAARWPFACRRRRRGSIVEAATRAHDRSRRFARIPAHGAQHRNRRRSAASAGHGGDRRNPLRHIAELVRACPRCIDGLPSRAPGIT